MQARSPEDAVREALRSVVDPEIPSVNIVDLGIVESVRVAGSRAEIGLVPTFSGCPALSLIRDAVVDRVRAVPGIAEVEVTFLLIPAWSTDRVSPAGRMALQSFGVAPPDRAQAPACPFCGSRDTRLESAFGPTRCRSVFYCDSCRNPFERMKVV